MSEYRYAPGALTGDLARAGIGFVLCAIPLVAVSMDMWMMVLLAALAGLFALFGVRTWRRRGTCIAMDDTGITTTGLKNARIPWGDLRQFKLSYFSTRRDRSNGWMQLNLGGTRGGLSIDSNLDGFEEICRRALLAATDNKIELTSATMRNLAELGLVSDFSANSKPHGGTTWGNPADWRR